jgi:hypothetical protein
VTGHYGVGKTHARNGQKIDDQWATDDPERLKLPLQRLHGQFHD